MKLSKLQKYTLIIGMIMPFIYLVFFLKYNILEKSIYIICHIEKKNIEYDIYLVSAQ